MPKKILLVDDECSIRDALSKLLQAESYEVVLAGNADDAIEKHLTGNNDLVLLDLNLPARNAWLTLQRLREINPLVPIIVITDRAQQRESVVKAGADALMEKPLDVPCLLQSIRELLAEPPECHVWRAGNSDSGCEDASADSLQFREKLHKQVTTPYRCPGVVNN